MNVQIDNETERIVDRCLVFSCRGWDARELAHLSRVVMEAVESCSGLWVISQHGSASYARAQIYSSNMNFLLGMRSFKRLRI